MTNKDEKLNAILKLKRTVDLAILDFRDIDFKDLNSEKQRAIDKAVEFLIILDTFYEKALKK